jgi:hypothetical protein
VPKKKKKELPYYSAILLLWIYLKATIQTPMFIAFKIAKLWKQPRLLNGLRKCGIYVQWDFN